jgi:hypothetical protein
MPTIVDTPPPDHRPILVCPGCGVHTPHTWAPPTYTCQRCGLAHPLPTMTRPHQDVEPIWCPRCRVASGSPAWGPVQGQRRCRVCGTSVMANMEEPHG